MKQVLKTFLYQQYQWNLKYAYTKEQAAMKSIYLLSVLAGVNVVSLLILFSFLLKMIKGVIVPLSIIYTSFFITSLTIIIACYFSFVKNRKYLLIQAIPRKQVVILYYICTLVLFVLSLFSIAFSINKSI